MKFRITSIKLIYIKGGRFFPVKFTWKWRVDEAERRGHFKLKVPAFCMKLETLHMLATLYTRWSVYIIESASGDDCIRCHFILIRRGVCDLREKTNFSKFYWVSVIISPCFSGMPEIINPTGSTSAALFIIYERRQLLEFPNETIGNQPRREYIRLKMRKSLNVLWSGCRIYPRRDAEI